jgi:tetratricopeptide (TPR) repeat protein/S1-C subfamily serine protease
MNKYLILIPLCLLTFGCSQAISKPTVTVSPTLQTVADNNVASAQTIAREITVRVQAGDRRGSGTMIAKRGNRYTILTNSHVANKANTYQITTPDGKTYSARCAQPLKQGTCTTDNNHDLALLEFTSTQSYTVPQWGDSRALKPGDTIYSAGYPFEGQEPNIDRGKITQQTSKPLQGGYQIGFSSNTEQGMSGGALVNTKGELIGIIGFNAQPILNDGYRYQDGSQPTDDVVKELRKSSFAIPIATLARLDSKYTALLPKQERMVAKANYTGVVKRVDEIAQQITVRIEDKNGGNGSGVIVAKDGDTYYVATAAHVVESKEGEKIAKTVITPTQEQIALSDGEINVVNKALDVAIVKFKSQQNYRIAEIGNYQFKDAEWIFLSGFPGKDPSKQRRLELGWLRDKEKIEFLVKERASLSGGNNLVYTNLSLPGMSGGAVLDRQGRLVGINTGAENEQILTKSNAEEINFGYALGIPVSTVIRVASQGQLPTTKLQVTITPVPNLTQREHEAITPTYLSALSQPSPSSGVKDWLDYGNLLWRAGRNREAVNSFEKAIGLLQGKEADKDLKKIAYFGRGLAWWSDSKNAEAEKSFAKAVEVDSGFSQAWRYQGLLLKELKRYPEALASYRQAIQNKKEDFVLYVEQGDILQEMDRSGEAINSYNLAIKLNSNHPWAYINRGNAYYDLKQYSQAIADYNQAIKLNPQLVEAYNNLGTIYAELKQYPQAIADYNQAIKLNPQYAGAYINRGIVYAELKQYPQAIADYNQSIKLNPQLAQAYYNLGTTYNQLRQYPQAIVDYNQAIKLNPQYAEAYSNRGVAYFEQKQYPQAISDYNQAIKLNPQYAEAYNNRGNAYYDLKQYSQAIADYNQAIKFNPQYAGTYSNRGNTYAAVKQYPEAIADYSQAIKLNPQYVTAYFRRGTAYAELKQYPQAKADLKKAAELFRAQNNTAGYQTAMILLQQIP